MTPEANPNPNPKAGYEAWRATRPLPEGWSACRTIDNPQLHLVTYKKDSQHVSIGYVAEKGGCCLIMLIGYGTKKEPLSQSEAETLRSLLAPDMPEPSRPDQGVFGWEPAALKAANPEPLPV